jgi:arabinofuranosyltransferase
LKRLLIHVLTLVPPLALLLIHGLSYDYINDDAYISFRYARNLARGDGLVFNVGEPVEGYTNFLWTLQVGAGLALGGDPERFAPWLGLFWGAGAVVLAGMLLCRRGMPVWWVVVPLTVLSAGVPFALWSAAGLETGLVAFFMVLGVLLLDRVSAPGPVPWWLSWVLGGTLGLATLTRPDNGLLFLFCVGWLILERKWRRLLPLLTAWAAVVLPWFGWRLWYYGKLLPNSLLLRTGAEWTDYLHSVREGLAYSGGYLAFVAGPFLLLSGGLLFRAGRVEGVLGLRQARRDLIFVVCFLAYLAAVGGDEKVFYRLAAPLTPLLVCGLGLGAWSLLQRRSWRGVFWGLLGVAWCGWLALGWSGFLAEEYHRRLHHLRDHLYPERRLVARWISEQAPPGATLAMSAMGLVPYLTDLRTYDCLGVVDNYIARLPVRSPEMLPAHRKSDFGYILRRRPAFIVWSTFISTGEMARAARRGYVRVAVKNTRIPVMCDPEQVSLPLRRPSKNPARSSPASPP